MIFHENHQYLNMGNKTMNTVNRKMNRILSIQHDNSGYLVVKIIIFVGLILS